MVVIVTPERGQWDFKPQHAMNEETFWLIVGSFLVGLVVVVLFYCVVMFFEWWFNGRFK